MSQLFQLANARILLWLNHTLAQNPELHGAVAWLTGSGAHLLALATLLALWFWPEPKDAFVLAEVQLPPRARDADPGDAPVRAANSAANSVADGAAQNGSGPKIPAPAQAMGQRAVGSAVAVSAVAVRDAAGEVVATGARVDRIGRNVRWAPHRRAVNVTRLEGRAQLLVLFAVIAGTYIAAHLVAMLLRVPRPFAIYLPVHGGGELFDSLGARASGSFPAGGATMLGALPVALFFRGQRIRWLAWAWVLLAFALAMGRVAVGVHYPVDVVAGVVLGAFVAALAMNAFRSDGRLSRASEAVARGFDQANAPYCYFLYMLMAVLAVEFALSFEHIFSTLGNATSDIAYRLRK